MPFRARVAIPLLLLALSAIHPPGTRGGGRNHPPLAAASPVTDSRPSATFDEVWHDGRAELCGYRLTVDRYGSPRRGRAVLITVTEPFSRSRHVKVEEPAPDDPDVFEALKVNLVRSFRTGIYDYHTMVSLFTEAASFAPVKVTFSASEWCGHVYEETIFEEGEMRASVSSYFEDESARVAIPAPRGGVVEDDLFVLLRGLRGDFLEPGESRDVPFLASPFFRRLAHRPIAWTRASVSRLPTSERVRVPAGTFAATVYRVRTEDGREGRFHIEDGAARRVLRWAWTRTSGSAGSRGATLGATDAGELTGSRRLPYWKLHDPGEEKHLRELGLSIPPP